MENTKHPKEYISKEDIGFIKDPFQPEFRYDSRGRFIMPLPGFSKMMLSVEPGSRNIAQSTEDEAGNPQTEPGSLKTGFLNAATAIKVGPEGGWITQISGGDFQYPLSYFNETTEEFKFYLDKEGNIYLKGKIIADADSEVDWSYIKNISVLNAHIGEVLTIANTEAKTTFSDSAFKDMAWEDLVELTKLGLTIIEGGYLKTILIDAQYIQAGIITGRTVQTDFPTGTNKVIRLSSVDTHKMEFMYGVDVIGLLEVLYNPVNDLAGFGLSGGGGAYISGSGKSNMGVIGIGLTNKYFNLEWYGGDPNTERIVTNARLDANWLPYSNNSKDLGNVTYKFRYLFLGSVPSQDYHAATKAYVDSVAGGFACGDLAACSLSGLGTRPHSQLTNVNPSDHHSSVSNGLAITPSSVVASGKLAGSLLNIGASSAYNYIAAKLYLGDDLEINAGKKLIAGSANFYLNINQKTYSGNYACGFDHIGDIMPQSSGLWDLGSSSNKFNLFYGGVTACSLPTYNSALRVLKKIKKPKIHDGHFGKKQYFIEDEFPEEIKYLNKRTGKKIIETFHILGFVVQALRELTEKVEELEK